jgi:hypothetical protein
LPSLHRRRACRRHRRHRRRFRLPLPPLWPRRIRTRPSILRPAGRHRCQSLHHRLHRL